MSGAGTFVAFLLAIVWVVGTIWVFADATVNSSQSAFLWGLVAFFGGVLGILLYALLGRDGDEGGRGKTTGGRGRSRGRPSHVCRSCGEEYFTDPSTEIGTCQSCGGIKVEKAG